MTGCQAGGRIDFRSHRRRLCVGIRAMVLVVLGSWLLPATSRGGLLTNGSFEDFVSTASGAPQVPGVWQGDFSSIGPAVRGMQPADGLGMLKFLAARPVPPGDFSTGCEVYQLIDLSDYRTAISTGFQAVRLSAQFNRISFDEQTDDRFGLGVFAMDSLAGVPDPGLLANKKELAMSSDGNPSTWQPHEMSFLLPENTAAIYVLVEASENRFNDPAFPEFDGHYVDNVELELFTAVPGDTNNDKLVDLTDLANVRNHFGETGVPFASGEAFPQDGSVDLSDLNLVRGNFGRTALAVVPEPGSLSLACLAVPIVLGLSRRTPRPS